MKDRTSGPSCVKIEIEEVMDGKSLHQRECLFIFFFNIFHLLQKMMKENVKRKRKTLLFELRLTFLSLLVSSDTTKKEREKRPNILFQTTSASTFSSSSGRDERKCGKLLRECLAES